MRASIFHPGLFRLWIVLIVVWMLVAVWLYSAGVGVQLLSFRAKAIKDVADLPSAAEQDPSILRHAMERDGKIDALIQSITIATIGKPTGDQLKRWQFQRAVTTARNIVAEQYGIAASQKMRGIRDIAWPPKP